LDDHFVLQSFDEQLLLGIGGKTGERPHEKKLLVRVKKECPKPIMDGIHPTKGSHKQQSEKSDFPPDLWSFLLNQRPFVLRKSIGVRRVIKRSVTVGRNLVCVGLAIPKPGIQLRPVCINLALLADLQTVDGEVMESLPSLDSSDVSAEIGSYFAPGFQSGFLRRKFGELAWSGGGIRHPIPFPSSELCGLYISINIFFQFQACLSWRSQTWNHLQKLLVGEWQVLGPHENLVVDSAEYGVTLVERGVQAYTDTPFVINGLRVSSVYPCKSYATGKQRHGTASKV